MVTVAGKKPSSSASAAQFVAEIDALIEFAPSIPYDPMRQRALEVYKQARQYFVAQASDVTRSYP
jgi:hypothetical protein